jgi:putative transposase
MARTRTPSFVIELPLRVAPANERALTVRLEAARNIYNACLTEALRRRDRMRESKAWQSRAKSRKEICAEYGFRATAIQQYAQQCRDACWIKVHLGGHDTQPTSLRAFRAVEQYAFGRHGRPRPAVELNTIEGKEAKSTIVFRDNNIFYGGLRLPAVIRDARQREALKARTKYCRIVRRRIRGRARWYVQLVQAGVSPARRAVGQGVVGLDIGPSTIAAVGETEAVFERFCPTVAQPWAEQRRRLAP